MSRSDMNGMQKKHSRTSCLQSDVLNNVTNLLGRVTETTFLNFKCGRANRYNARMSV